ncbi:MAG: hypothetical protein P4L69_24350 [Desulfosporosinus sp.]|nr:hypothetical protein [Desulfosporosinus sp.]
MSDNNEDKKEDNNDIRARHLFVINESQAGLDTPAGENPASIHEVYNFDRRFTGQGVIAIVSAYNYPTALADFNVFSKQFGLPLESSTNPLAATNSVFQVVNARGTEPALDTGWAMESALDIQWAHAMAPFAKIVLVQSSSNTFIDLFQAVDVANAIPDVQVVSMSWGGYEFSGETAFDAHLKMPGVVYVAGAGDLGGNTVYPSVSQYVVSVGGTKINRNASGKFIGETGWSNSGGGPSIFVPIPAYQAAQPTVAAKCGNWRGTPDVAFDADPTSGVAIYDSTPYNGISGWTTIGGTSLGAPCWAGIISCINGARIKPKSTAEFLTFLYRAGGSICYRDILVGTAGAFSCTTGWDFVTGWGSPNIRNLIIYGLSINKTASHDFIALGENLTYSIIVANNGTATATNVIMVDTLPSNVTLVSVTSSQGTWTQSGNSLIFHFGNITPSTNVTVQIIITPTVAGTITNITEVNGLVATATTTVASFFAANENECVIVEKVYASCQQRECFSLFAVNLPEGVPPFTFVSITFGNGVIIQPTIITPIPSRPNFSRVQFTIQIPYILNLKDSVGQTFTLTGNLPDIDKDIVMYFPLTRPEFDLNLRAETRTEIIANPIFTATTVQLAIGSFVVTKVTGLVQLLIPSFDYCPEPCNCEEFQPQNPCVEFLDPDETPFPIDFFPPQLDAASYHRSYPEVRCKNLSLNRA